MSYIPQQRVNLTEARRLRVWSQKELAEQLGTTQVNVSRWERGLTTPTPYFRSKLMALLRKSDLELGLRPNELAENRIYQLPSFSEPSPRKTVLPTLDTFPLHTKLFVPLVPVTLVARPRLTQWLNEALAHKLLLLSASAGSGKTTLLSEWVQHYGHPVAWVSLDTLDNDPIRFWRYVACAVQKAYPALREEALTFLHLGESASLEAALTALVNAFAPIKQTIIIILDDYHLVTNQAVHETVAFFLAYLPRHVHLILASRCSPCFPLARFHAADQLAELRSWDLRFLSHELRLFLTQRMQLCLSEEVLAALESSTEGWIAGLQLAALSLQGKEHSATSPQASPNNHPSILDYLVDEVLHQQNSHVQTFLLSTSILDQLSGPLCDAVTGQQGSQLALEQLERANLFLLSLDHQRQWYRYHSLFKEMLRNRLQALHPESISELYERAFIWCTQNGFMLEAIQYALAAGAFDQVAKLIVQLGEALMRRGETLTVQTWLDELPDECVRATPQLCLLQAWILLTLGQFETAEQWLQEVERTLQKSQWGKTASVFFEQDTIDRPFQEHVSPSPENLLSVTAALRAHITAVWGNPSSTVASAHQALDHLSEDSLYLRSLSAFNLGMACWIQDDVLVAEQAFTQAHVLAQASENRYVALLATCSLAQMQMIRGQRRLAAKTGRQAVNIASQEQTKAFPAAAYAYIGMGQHYYEWNDLETATWYIQKGIVLSERWKDEDTLVYGCLELAQVKHAQGDTKASAELLQRAEEAAQSHHPHVWIVNALVVQQATLALAQGDVEKARRWMQRTDHSSVFVFSHPLSARLHLAQGQFIQALEIVEQQLQTAQQKGQIGRVIELHVLEAITHERQANTAKAVLALEKALSLAEPEGYIRMFINEGEVMSSLLSQVLVFLQQRKEVSQCHVVLEYSKKLLKALDKTEEEISATPARPVSPLCQPPTESFSTREWEIAHLVKVGLSNREIAQQLIIS